MSLNEQVSAERVHIGFFGLRNAGKSSLVNAVTNQELSLVSAVAGTTTDPVQKAMELLPIGAVVIIDTPGFDDEGELGALRVERTLQVLRKTDIAVLVADAQKGLQEADRQLTALFAAQNTPYLTVYNKADLLAQMPETKDGELFVSALKGDNIGRLKTMIGSLADKKEDGKRLVADLLQSGDLVVLVVPIDASAPKGRLILPQQQTIRDILDVGASALVTGVKQLPQTLRALSQKPALVITDSQVFAQADKAVPPDLPLTSFSLLFARYKGDLPQLVRGAAQLDKLQDGDSVLISEGCTHHRQCEDIGTVKLPSWLANYTGKKLDYHFSSGGEFPADLSRYALIVHCGACMLNGREMQWRIACTKAAGVPLTNYGIAIAWMQGILKRSLAPFGDILAKLD